MRLATVFDTEINEPRPVFELPGGQRVELRELFRAPGVAQNLDGMPLYFTDLATAVQYLDDVIEAVRAWATQRAEAAAHPLGETSGVSRTTTLPFCPPIPAPRAYRTFDTFEQHVKSTRARRGQEMSPIFYDEPAFSFSNAASLIGHGAGVFAPRGSGELDFGLQLGLVIGVGGRDIPASEAWNHVAGFTIINAFSARDLQRRALLLGLGSGKGRDFATAVGPYLVTFDALGDRIDLQGRIHLNMTARVNGNVLCRADAASMHFSWPAIIEFASRDADLHPGDLISSGTAPGGSIIEIGTEKTGGAWLRPGDVVELEIERLGVLRSPIIERPASRTAHPTSEATPAGIPGAR